MASSMVQRLLVQTKFDQTLWADSQFSREYRDHADYYIPERPYLFHVLRSFYRHFVSGEPNRQLCDLGCGDGVLAHQLLGEDPSVGLTLIDASVDMLEAARRRLTGCANPRFVACTFEAIIKGDIQAGPFDFIFSGFAIHHLLEAEKASLFTRLFEWLQPGGWFLNIDTVFPSEPLFTDWYYELWREWIRETEKRTPRARAFRDIPDKARTNPDNKLSSLGHQLEALRLAGFEQVDSHYRNGLFAIYSGRKPDFKGCK